MTAALSLAAAAWLLVAPSRPARRRLGLAAVTTASVGFAAWARRGEAARREAEAVTLCITLAAELRAGLTPAAALAGAAGELSVLGPAVTRAARAVGRGARLGDELADVAAQHQCRRVSVAAGVCLAAEATGAPVADVLERIGRGLAADDHARLELDALAAGPRATAAVLAVLPLIAVALATALGLSPLPVLLHPLLGPGLALAAAVLEVAGFYWVRRITASALRA